MVDLLKTSQAVTLTVVLPHLNTLPSSATQIDFSKSMAKSSSTIQLISSKQASKITVPTHSTDLRPRIGCNNTDCPFTSLYEDQENKNVGGDYENIDNSSPETCLRSNHSGSHNDNRAPSSMPDFHKTASKNEEYEYNEFNTRIVSSKSVNSISRATHSPSMSSTSSGYSGRSQKAHTSSTMPPPKNYQANKAFQPSRQPSNHNTVGIPPKNVSARPQSSSENHSVTVEHRGEKRLSGYENYGTILSEFSSNSLSSSATLASNRCSPSTKNHQFVNQIYQQDETMYETNQNINKQVCDTRDHYAQRSKQQKESYEITQSICLPPQPIYGTTLSRQSPSGNQDVKSAPPPPLPNRLYQVWNWVEIQINY